MAVSQSNKLNPIRLAKPWSTNNILLPAAPTVEVADLPPLSEATMTAVRRIYDQYARPQVHLRW